MKEGIETKSEKSIKELMEEAASLYFSEIEPRKERGEINKDLAERILDKLIDAEDVSDDDPNKPKMVTGIIDRIASLLKHLEENKQKEIIQDSEKSVSVVEKAEEERKEDESQKDESEGKGVPLPYADYSKKEAIEAEIPEAPEAEIEAPELKKIKEKEEVPPVREEQSESEIEPRKETEEEKAERLNKDYLNEEDIFYDTLAKWFAEKEDLYDRGKISEKKFDQIESLHTKLTAPVSHNKAAYLGELENAYDSGVITEKDYEKLYPLALEVDRYKYLFRSDEEKDLEDRIKYQREKEEEEDFLTNLDNEKAEAPVDEEELKKQRELRKKAKKLGIQRKKRKFNEKEEEELEEIIEAEEKIPQEILDIKDDASGFKALAKWYLRKIKEQQNYEKAKKHIEKLGRFLSEKNRKIDEYNRALENHKKRTKERKQELENVEDDNIILSSIRNVKTGAKIKDLFELKEKFGKVIKYLEERLEDNYDRGKIKTKEYNEKAKVLKKVYKSGDVKEIRAAIEDYFKKGIINKEGKKELLFVLNGYVKK